MGINMWLMAFLLCLVSQASAQPQVQLLHAYPTPLSAGTWSDGLTVIFVSAATLVSGSTIDLTVLNTVPSDSTPVFRNMLGDARNFASIMSDVGITDCNVTGIVINQRLRLQLSNVVGNQFACSVPSNSIVRLIVPWWFTLVNPQYGSSVLLGITIGSSSAQALVPWTYTAPQSRLAALQFPFAQPSTTLMNQRPASLVVTLIPGIQVLVSPSNPGTIAIWSTDPLFAANQTGAPTISVGSCTSSTVISTAGVNGVGSAIRIILGPIGCVLPADRAVSFTIPGDYLAPLSNTRTQYFLTASTNMEPQATEVQVPFSTGSSQVRDVTAVPSTTLTGVQLSGLILSFTLTTALTAANNWVVVTTTPGVFRPVVNNATVSIVTTPTACSSVVAGSWAGEGFIFWLGPSSTCFGATPAGTRITFNIPGSVLFPNLPAGTPVRFAIHTATDGASNIQVGYTTTAGCGSGTTLNILPNSIDGVTGLGDVPRANLADSMLLLSNTDSASFQCTLLTPNTFYYKISEPAQARTIPSTTWQRAFTAPTVTITNWGFMYTFPMLAIVVSFPPNQGSVQSLNINPNVNSNWFLIFLVRIDRFMSTGALANANNPLQFQVATTGVVQVQIFDGPGNTGTNVDGSVGNWAQTSSVVLVSSTRSGTFAGYGTSAVSPPPDSGSDTALYGLLALIAAPLLCLALLALLLIMLKRREDPRCPCVCACPAQEFAMVPMDCAVTYPMVPAPAPYPTPLVLEATSYM